MSSSDKPAASASTSAPAVDWADLVERIRAGDNSGMEELYRVFTRGVRYYLCRHLGAQELDDRVHDTFLIVIQAIQKGDLREPERLMGFVRTVLRRHVAAHIDRAVQNRRDHADVELGFRVADLRATPEEHAMVQERADLMEGALLQMSERDREILTRFYLKEESQEEICDAMSLTETQFRLLKSRAKARFGEVGKRRLSKSIFGNIFLRRSAEKDD
jgi:RNA polymerase sigma-70 factor (ECF subfamily)